MLHGQSAGAIDSFIVATLPQASTLFHAAILESGGGRDIQLNNTIQALGVSYAKSLNCSVTDVSTIDIVARTKSTYETATGWLSERRTRVRSQQHI
jgi:carboxylesterase type B